MQLQRHVPWWLLLLTASLSRWSFVTGKLQPKGQQDKINAAGVLLFKNMFELSPRLKLLFPFKDAAGEALDSVSCVHHLIEPARQFLAVWPGYQL